VDYKGKWLLFVEGDIGQPGADGLKGEKGEKGSVGKRGSRVCNCTSVYSRFEAM